MDKNILDVMRLKKKVVKISAIAFMSAVSMFGVPHVAHAMKQACNNNVVKVVDEQVQDGTYSHRVVGEQKQCETSVHEVEREQVPVDTSAYKSIEEQVLDDTSAYKEIEGRKSFDASVHKMVEVRRSGGTSKVNPDYYKLGQEYSDRGNYEEAKKYFESAVKAGNERAHYYLGWIYLEGEAGEKDETKATEHFKSVLPVIKKSNDAESLFMYGCLLMDKRLERLGVLKINATQAIKFYQESAEKGFVQAQFSLGVCYTNGYGVSKDETAAFEWYKLAAQSGHIEALYCLALCYANGKGVEQNDFEATRLFLVLEKQDVRAQFNLGICYFQGRGIAKDEAKAIECYTEAALKGYALAQYNLAALYLNGQGVEKNLSVALYWLDQAAQSGHIEAQFKLGEYYWGQGNKYVAFYWLNKAACSGYVEAQFKLGEYHKDQGNGDVAFYWTCQAAQKGHAEAQFKLGEYCWNDNKSMACYWFKRAANNRHVEAIFRLGTCYFDGQGVVKDLVKAFNYYVQAALYEHAKAQCKLADCYLNGYGVDEDVSKAFFWYEQAHSRGDVQALFGLAVCYTNGYGVDKDETKAFKCYKEAAINGNNEARFCIGEYFSSHGNMFAAHGWYRQAAEQKYAPAIFKLGECCDSGGLGVIRDIKLAIKHYLEAAEQKYAPALFALGECYAKGTGVKQKIKVAMKYYLKAAEQGYAPAQFNLGKCYFEKCGENNDIREAARWFYAYKVGLQLSESVKMNEGSFGKEVENFFKQLSFTDESIEALKNATDFFKQVNEIDKSTSRVNQFARKYFEKRFDKLRDFSGIAKEDTNDVIYEKLEQMDIKILNKLLIEADNILRFLRFVSENIKVLDGREALIHINALLDDKFRLPANGHIVLTSEFLKPYVILPWRSSVVTELEDYEILANIYGTGFSINSQYDSSKEGQLIIENVYDYIFGNTGKYRGRLYMLCNDDVGKSRENLAREMYWFRCMNERQKLGYLSAGARKAFERCKSLAQVYFETTQGHYANNLMDIMFMWARCIDYCEYAMGIGTSVCDQRVFDERFTTAYRQYLAEKVLISDAVSILWNKSTGVEKLRKILTSDLVSEQKNFYRILVSYLLNVTPTVGRILVDDSEVTGEYIANIVSETVDWNDMCMVAQYMYQDILNEKYVMADDNSVVESDSIKEKLVNDIEEKYSVTFVEFCSVVDETFDIGQFEDRLKRFLKECEISGEDKVKVDMKENLGEWIEGKRTFTVAELANLIVNLDPQLVKAAKLIPELTKLGGTLGSEDEKLAEYYARVLYPIHLLKTGLVKMN